MLTIKFFKLNFIRDKREMRFYYELVANSHYLYRSKFGFLFHSPVSIEKI